MTDDLNDLDARIAKFKQSLAEDGVLAKDWAKWDAEHEGTSRQGAAGHGATVSTMSTKDGYTAHITNTTKENDRNTSSYRVVVRDPDGNTLSDSTHPMLDQAKERAETTVAAHRGK